MGFSACGERTEKFIKIEIDVNINLGSHSISMIGMCI